MLGLVERHPLAAGVVGDLVAAEAAVIEPDHGFLFVAAEGEPIAPKTLSPYVSRYVKASGAAKTGSRHLFRHAMATLMLENGTDVRMIRAIFGHVELTTTEIYTHVAITKLKQVHTATHPAALLLPQAKRGRTRAIEWKA